MNTNVLWCIKFTTVHFTLSKIRVDLEFALLAVVSPTGHSARMEARTDVPLLSSPSAPALTRSCRKNEFT